MTEQTDLTKKLLSEIDSIPHLSSCASELISIVNNENHSSSEIIKVIECDASLTSEVIKLINSPIYGFKAKITSLDKAISLMGEEPIINLAVNSATDALFNNPLLGYESSPGALWDHDLKAAIAAREISKYSKKTISPQTAYTGGLLHDIGKSLISKYLEGNAPKILRALDHGKVKSFDKAEDLILGTTHAHIGYKIAQYWSLPEPLPCIIKYHHTPSLAPEKYRPFVFCVHLGDIVAMLSGCGTGADTLAYSIDENYENYMTIQKDNLSLIILEVEQQFSKIKSEIFTS